MTDDEIDHEWTDVPVCPYCGATDDDWSDCLPPKHDGDSWESTCGHCERDFTVTMFVSTHFDTERAATGESDAD